MQTNQGLFERLKARFDRSSMRRYRRTNNSVDLKPTSAVVTVNVYDMLWLNVYTNSFGLGVYHTGVVVYGTEYCYGGHPLSYSGIFAMVPQDAETLGPNYSHKTSIELGYTDFTEADVALILEDMGPQYRGDQYHLLHRNCNHFSNEFVQILCGASLPKWINRLASVGAKLPFIERSIPRVWLTPRPFEELDSSHPDRLFNSIQNSLTPSSSLSSVLLPEDHTYCIERTRRTHRGSSESASSHKRSLNKPHAVIRVGNSNTMKTPTTFDGTDSLYSTASTPFQRVPTPFSSHCNGTRGVPSFPNSNDNHLPIGVSETPAPHMSSTMPTDQTEHVQRNLSSPAYSKLESESPLQTPPSQNRPFACSNLFTSKLLLRLQHLCGTSQQDESTEQFSVCSSREHGLSDAFP